MVFFGIVDVVGLCGKELGYVVLIIYVEVLVVVVRRDGGKWCIVVFLYLVNGLVYVLNIVLIDYIF